MNPSNPSADALNRRAIAKLCECSPTTLYTWLKRRRPEVLAKEAGGG